jgi:hypothetical protein
VIWTLLTPLLSLSIYSRPAPTALSHAVFSRETSEAGGALPPAVGRLLEIQTKDQTGATDVNGLGGRDAALVLVINLKLRALAGGKDAACGECIQ